MKGLFLVCALVGCRPSPRVENPRVLARVDADAIIAGLKEYEDARASLEISLKTGRVGANTATLPVSPPKLAPGQRAKIFRELVVMVCKPTDVAATFSSYTEALTLFSETQSKKIGSWIHVAQGALSLGGSIAAAAAFAGDSDDKTDRLQIGVALLGAGGVLELVKATPLFQSKLVNDVLVRVELNRQLGILLRQYTPAIDQVKKVCDSELRPLQATIPQTQQGDQQLTQDVMKKVLEASIGLDKVFEGLLNIGSASAQIGDELRATKLKVGEEVERNLSNIAKTTESLRKGWLVDKSVLYEAIECMQFCEAIP